MTRIDPLMLANVVEERYRRYLETTFFFKDRVLRESFAKELTRDILSKGPFLQANPVFKTGRTPAELFTTLLGDRPEAGFLEAIRGDRPLYRHQEQAISHASAGRNVIVATGTGSGKTEAFLLPILHHLYQEYRAGTLNKPGVRAMILYPMNALAFDQRTRLGDYCRALEQPGTGFRFTFGQYIGDTPEDRSDSRRNAGDLLRKRMPGELVLRKEMREAPPHILLTNYSMLEYLLLRPDDSPLFDDGKGATWSFLVLDEAHQYRGSKGTEMAMLLRRLKQRLRDGGRHDPLRCIATSATLIGGDGDKGRVAKFAAALLGEPFEEQAVILGESEPIPVPAGVRKLNAADYEACGRILDESGPAGDGTLAEITARIGANRTEGEPARRVGGVLEADARAAALRGEVSRNPVDVRRELADRTFPELDPSARVPATVRLAELLSRAKSPESSASLLSPRYHLFLRSLEGAFVSYYPEKRIYLERHALGEDEAAFEIALCRECGQHYFVGRRNTERLLEADRDPASEGFGVSFFRPLEPGDSPEVEAEDETDRVEPWKLCTRCGAIGRDSTGCGHQNAVISVAKEPPPKGEDKADQMVRCGACGYGGGKDPVREIIYGNDGPQSVVATTLHEHLPDDLRKILAFADSRQEAAFFAWYLEDSHRQLFNRNILLQAARRHHEGVSLKTLAGELRSDLRLHGAVSEATDDKEASHAAWKLVYREFLTEERRLSLEGVGLVRWEMKWPSWLPVPQVLLAPPWSLSEREARDVVQIILNFLREDGAVELWAGNDRPPSWKELELLTGQTAVRIGRPRAEKYVRAFDGPRTKRASFLARLASRPDLPQDEAKERAVDCLRHVWETIQEADDRGRRRSDPRLMVEVNDARRLNPEWWRVRSLGPDAELQQCDQCRRVQSYNVRGVCVRNGCDGTVRTTMRASLPANHYRELYEHPISGPMRVEEHTAQLEGKTARGFQRDFQEGRIAVLSCSTTFELGVDLGDLDVVFLRNVPPEAFNYAQRVGRAGRRPGHVGFAVTYCRRGPHDLYHFAQPDRMLRGSTGAPVITLQNKKILGRHVAAVALSEFFRAHRERFGDVKALCGSFEHPTGTSELRRFLDEKRDRLGAVLRGIVPDGMHKPLGLHDGSWTKGVASDEKPSESPFALAEAEVCEDWRLIQAAKNEAKERDDGRRLKWAKDRENTLAGEHVLAFLSRKVVIHKYGFPVDVVALDTLTAGRAEARAVSLERDLSIAIAEFAPSSKVVANKQEWESAGLKRVAEKEWKRFWYARCPTHNWFDRREKSLGDPWPPRCRASCGCSPNWFEYIEPRFGFVTAADSPRPLTRRPARQFTTRPYFIGLESVREEDAPIDLGPVQLHKACPGSLVVLCEGSRGRGFYICRACGTGARNRVGKHKTPYGRECSGTLDQVSLGHELPTDVLKIRFRIAPAGEEDPYWLTLGLAYALVHGAAELLEVPATDLNATVSHDEAAGLPPIILYDNVPGGAGLVARLEDVTDFRETLKKARVHVNGNCGCSDETSCYGCLRSYRNQFAHNHLRRGPVRQFLDSVIVALG